ncbi:TetR/AcrR family transcriptional regulator [Pseudonocardia kongjuensis]|uniref:TetR/AcrR family transcriptional regulator n=1 Tax=Pseudonocardia kongjuensis TaxID=102227 RepID=A0ABN1XGK8_9PSEU
MGSDEAARRSGAGRHPQRRSYTSTLRDERAADTRTRIVEAARELFATRGFDGTTIAVIAKRAGVATPTVYAVFSNKAAIVSELLSRLESEADAERWWSRIEDEADPFRKLDLYASFHRHLFSNGRDVWAAAVRAAGDATVVELQGQGARNAKHWLVPIVAALAEAGALEPGLTQEQAVDRAWLMSAMELYFRAVTGLGWSDDDYEQWLMRVLRTEVTGAGR